MTSARIVLSIALATSFGAVFAQDQAPGLGDSYGDAFVHYHPYVVPGQAKPPQSKASAAAAAPHKEVGPQKVDVAWLRKNYPLLEERAINDPIDANVSAYLYVKRVTMDKAQRFSEMVAKVTKEDPLLDENNRVPYASAGARAVQNANYQAQQQAVRELAQIGGLMIFVDGTCRFCAMQLPVLQMVRREFGMEFLVVSIDGTAPKGTTAEVLRDTGLFKKLGLRLTPSIVYVPSPKGYADGVDPNLYLVVAQGYYTADELVKQIAFAGHSTKLLSKTTMAGLEVWDRGVASTDDLRRLELDASHPETIKQALQPLLMKQYGQTP